MESQERRTRVIWAGLLLGIGVVEGLIDHHLLGIHHVNETVPVEQRIWWDLAFLAWGAAMLIGGWALARAGEQEQDQGMVNSIDRTQHRKGHAGLDASQ
jgi:uncharacterized membrane protein